MPTVEKTIRVEVPLTTAFNQWTQFESFPEFMEGVEEVRQLDDKRLYWRAKVGGKTEEWNAEITQQAPDTVIAWSSTSGAKNAGVVTFQPLDANACQVTLKIEYEPDGVMENVGAMLGVVDRRVDGDLRRFKEFIESRGIETGAWRGRIAS